MARPEARGSFAASRASVALDAIRGFAALLVTIEHIKRRLFFAPYSEVPHPTPLVRLFYSITDFGSLAVIIFFVLSGFLVGGSLIRAYKADTWNWRSYLTHRFVRLWIVLIPALVLGGICDVLTIYSVRGHALTPFIQFRVSDTISHLTLPTFVGNVFFLQTLFVPIFGSNAPLWSLTYEFWYYMLFPLGFFAVMPRYRLATRLACLIAFALIFIVVRAPIESLAPIWLAGALLVYAPPLVLTSKARRIGVAAFLVILIALQPIYHRLPLLAEYVLGLATCALIRVVLSARDRANPNALSTRGIRLLARFSYTLYLIHTPVMYLVGVNLVRGPAWQPTFPHLAVACAVWLGTIALAWLIASLTEFHTDAVRRRVDALIPRHNPSIHTSAV